MPEELQYLGHLNVARAWAERDPAEAAAWAASLSDDATRSGALTSAVYAWSQSEPQAAADFVTGQIADPQTQADAASFLVTTWVASDTVAASTWANSLPAGPVRDAAAAALARGIGRHNREAALAWSRSIADPDLREMRTFDVVYDWLVADPAAARAWLESPEANVPADLKAELLAAGR